MANYRSEAYRLPPRLTMRQRRSPPTADNYVLASSDLPRHVSTCYFRGLTIADFYDHGPLRSRAFATAGPRT
ncbi:hypothetical protein IG631_08026 [Alternaria alternata]|nr:hypothetical protein IG631_08026 [Alternaria alternata]